LSAEPLVTGGAADFSSAGVLVLRKGNRCHPPTHTIGDFTAWKDHDAYQQAFTRLLRDLKAENR
jgi:hypothetical protein